MTDIFTDLTLYCLTDLLPKAVTLASAITAVTKTPAKTSRFYPLYTLLETAALLTLRAKEEPPAPKSVKAKLPSKPAPRAKKKTEAA